MQEEIFNKIKVCIDKFFDTNGYSPSVRDIAMVIGVSKSTVQRNLDTMRKLGIVKTGKCGIETEHIAKTERAVISVPILGLVPCGPLTEEEEYIDLIPILENLYMNVDAFLNPIRQVEVRYA